MRKILARAVLRSKTVDAFDEQFVCQEMSGSESMDFSEKLKENREGAFAWLFATKVKTPAGAPAFTAEEATDLARGSPAAFMPLFVACTGFVDPEKKASTPSSDSTTVSPLPSGEPSTSS